LKTRINPRILERIRKETEGDKAVGDFLEKLIWVEAERSGQWWWKEPYRKLLKDYAEGGASGAY